MLKFSLYFGTFLSAGMLMSGW